MRFYVVLGCLVTAALLGYAKRPSEYEVASDYTDERDLVADADLTPPLAIAEEDAAIAQQALPRPGFLALLTFSAAVIGAVSTVSSGECASSACLTTNIVDTTAAALHAADKHAQPHEQTVVSSTKTAATVTPGG